MHNIVVIPLWGLCSNSRFVESAVAEAENVKFVQKFLIKTHSASATGNFPCTLCVTSFFVRLSCA